MKDEARTMKQALRSIHDEACAKVQASKYIINFPPNLTTASRHKPYSLPCLDQSFPGLSLRNKLDALRTQP